LKESGVKNKTERDEIENQLRRPGRKRQLQPTEAELVVLNETSEAMLKRRGGGADQDKRLRFYSRWLVGVPASRAALDVGYSECYGKNLVEQLKKDPAIQAKVQRLLQFMPDQYRRATASLLPEIAAIEGAALDLYKQDPARAIDKPQLLKHLRQVTGVQGLDVLIQNNTMIDLGTLEKVKGVFSDSLIPGVVTDVESEER
jgi:hypothetical protein